MAYESKKREFSIKDEFERAEKEKSRKFKKRREYGEEAPWLKLLQIFGLSLLGGLVGGIIFFACHYWFGIFSVFFFIINGLAAYVFSKEFLKTDEKIKGRVPVIVAADILSVFLTLTSIYLLTPSFAEERIAKGFGIFLALRYYLFEGMINNMIWIEGIIFSLFGILIGWLLLRGSRKETAKRKKR